jgi:Xaa-Pro aminopeptidase
MIMVKLKLTTAFVAVVIAINVVHVKGQDARARYELLNLIRKEKFDLILPGAMRDNKVDMWIHVMRRGDPDPLALDLGATMGFIVFSDRGGDRIERAIIGTSFARADRSVYDMVTGDESKLTEYVMERDPKAIAVNMSEWLTHADGLSFNDHKKLVKLLGDKYATRLISSENVINDFRVRRVQTEIRTFANICELQRQIMETAYRNIKPGITTREDIGWWAQDQLLKNGIPSSNWGSSTPGVLNSVVSNRSETRKRGYILQPGDLLSWDWGIRHLNMGTDWKRNAYLLREGETDVPASVKHAWERGLKVRKVMRKKIRIGQTAGETLDACVKALEKEGYVYTPFVDTPKDREIVAALGDDERSGFSIDCHTVGNTGNSEIAVGPAFAPFRPYRAHVKIQPNNFFSFEYIVHTWIPEWDRRLAINFEDNHIVTHNGVEWLYPPNERIILVPYGPSSTAGQMTVK